MMAITPERKAEIIAALEKKCGPLPKVMPKVVTRDDATIRDADVAVSRADKNYPNSDDEGIVHVRRGDWVTIDIELWEDQQVEKRRYKRYLKELDPCDIGIYGAQPYHRGQGED
jgi:hypothetical protein